MSGADAVEKMEAGAQLVQLFTGFIYKGPALIAECSEAVAALGAARSRSAEEAPKSARSGRKAPTLP